MRHATGTIRGGHNPKRPYRATAAKKLLNHPEMADRAPGAMVAAAPAWPQAALQRFQALEPAPFVPQRLGLDLLEAPKPPTARPRVVAAACALPEAPLVGAEAERSQQIALRAPDQIVAHARWARPPLFERPRKLLPQKEGRRSADRRVQEPHRKRMRRASFLLPPFTGGPRPPGPHGAGALAFRRPTAASEVF